MRDRDLNANAMRTTVAELTQGVGRNPPSRSRSGIFIPWRCQRLTFTTNTFVAGFVVVDPW